MSKRRKMSGFGGSSLEQPRQWLGSHAARRALRRHRSRAGALPRLHCVGPAALQSIEVSLKTDGGGGGDEVGVGEERQLA